MPRDSTLNTRLFAAACLGITLLALALRLLHIDNQPLWADEAFSFFAAHVGRWPDDFLREGNPPLYFALLKLWTSVVGESTAAIRILSALFGLGFVAAAIWTAATLFDRRTALYAGLLTAASPMAIYYAQEARAYSMLLLALMLCLGTLWRALQTHRPIAWVFFAAAATFALYSHYLALFALAPSLVAVLLQADYKRHLTPYALALLSALVALAAWLVPSLAAGAGQGEIHHWIAEVWQRTPPLGALPKSFVILGLGSHAEFAPVFLKQFSALEPNKALLYLGLGILLLLVASALAVVIKRPRHPESGATLWLLVSLCLPLLGLWLLSWVRPYYVVGRYDMIVLPAFLLLIAWGLGQLHRWGAKGAWLAVGLGATLITVTGERLYGYYAAEPVAYGPPATATAELLSHSIQENDLLLLTGMRQLPVLYELRRYGVQWQGGTSCTLPSEASFRCVTIPYDSSDFGLLLGATRDGLQPTETTSDWLQWALASHHAHHDIWLVADIFRNRASEQQLQEIRRLLHQQGYRAVTLKTTHHDLRIIQLRRSR
ncbi:hypothetical protein CAI21_15065 [Alkalilimnicola ehrlichii]|uniref:Glycosyltransferase RgtA/B/C/D-like domain-containing protein n=1 Tax=Alkalilimnicola ehrlichii TaxID=351052 RepID=A0A3E0WT20_9GAMM|nr:glycosyltransferase family 39 protein [Alkalilimnicola ehrlichii]RFA27169.1 hypothetical protein CAI21_15065 [Alkalilimnicola ehrlichii]RFA35343.1 hypothetical protein CAL65_12725 [Alkalilimnicola ehrlichii]